MSQKKADMLMVTVSMAWGMTHILTKIGLNGIATYNLMMLRFSIAALAVALLCPREVKKIRKRTLISGMLLGILMWTVVTTVTMGLKTTSASSAGFLISAAVVFVPLIMSVIERKLPAPMMLFGIGLASIGIVLFCARGGLSLDIGTGLCIVSAFFYALQIVVTKFIMMEEEPIPVAICQLGFTAVLGLICGLCTEHMKLPGDGRTWFAVLGLALLCGAYAYVMQGIAQKYTTAERIGFLFALQPVFAAVFARLILGEVMGWTEYLGGACILTSVLISNKKKKEN